MTTGEGVALTRTAKREVFSLAARLVLVAVALTQATPAAADSSTGLAIGPSVGAVVGSPTHIAPAFGLDGSLALVSGSIITLASSGGSTLGVLWISGGILRGTSPTQLWGYGEIGSWFFVCYGAGASARLYGSAGGKGDVHLFVGVPIPLSLSNQSTLPYLQPYYRAHWAVDPNFGFDFHEFGLLVKLGFR